MTKKGLSLEQKRERVLEIFHQDDSVYQLKEIEKEAVKRGVTLQSVKDVVQSLVDDNLVHQDKIGSANFLWAFKAEAATKLCNEEAQLQANKRALQAELEGLQESLQQQKDATSDLEQRVALQQQVDGAQERLAALKREKAGLAGVDPERHAAVVEATGVAKDAANRWLDNLEALKDWCNKSFPSMQQQVEDFFKENGYREDMEYIT